MNEIEKLEGDFGRAIFKQNEMEIALAKQKELVQSLFVVISNKKKEVAEQGLRVDLGEPLDEVEINNHKAKA